MTPIYDKTGREIHVGDILLYTPPGYRIVACHDGKAVKRGPWSEFTVRITTDAREKALQKLWNDMMG